MKNTGIRNYHMADSGEDYLLAIYAICRAKGSARQIDIADDMGFSKPSVSRAVKNLTQIGLLRAVWDFNEKEVRLTKAGRALAEKLYRRRLIITAFLESFGLSKNDAEAEAHLWEHGVSDETANAMETALARTEALRKTETGIADRPTCLMQNPVIRAMPEKALNENTEHCFRKGSGEDYLLAIYTICRTEGSARQIDIAADLDVSKASVTTAVKTLTQKDLLRIVWKCNVKEVHLTELGRALAEKLYKRRLIVTAFLEFLGLSENDAEAEAHLWEHGVSDQTANAMEAVLAREDARRAPAS
jgi:Mn-dependent DtxR family transcriptional regulator